MSIRKNYEIELKKVHDDLISMCRAVQNAIATSMNALVGQDRELAQEVIDGDGDINRRERDIEQSCLKILLMEHPVAGDFREVSAALKMITDLERIGDQAGDIASLVLQFKDEKYCKPLVHLPKMAKLCKEMVKDSVASFINKDLELALSLKDRDDKIDELFDIIKSEMVEIIKNDGNTADQCILFMMIAKYFERIGDHAVNIGEWVEYTINGHHGGENF